VIGIGITKTDSGYNLRDAWWGVPRIGAVELAVVPKQLNELREVHVQTEALCYRFGVKVKPIGRKLHSPRKPLVKVPAEFLRGQHRAFAHAEYGNEFGVGVHRYKNPLVSELSRFALPDTAVFLREERPDFVNLNVLADKVLHSLRHKPLAAFTGSKQKPHDGIAVQTREPLRAANRTPFEKALNCLQANIGPRNHCGPRQPFMRFAERGATGLAAPALNTALTKVPESFAIIVVTTSAGHIGLVFLAGQADNEFASALRLTPRADLAPDSVAADAGAFLGEWTRPDLDGHLAVLQTGALPVELRAHIGGIPGLLPKNALRSVISVWWPSHSCPPFAWIERPNSFEASLGHYLFHQRVAHSVDLYPWRESQLPGIDHALKRIVHSTGGIAKVGKVETDKIKSVLHGSSGHRNLANPKDRADGFGKPDHRALLLMHSRSQRVSCRCDPQASNLVLKLNDLHIQRISLAYRCGQALLRISQGLLYGFICHLPIEVTLT
jgi:hypothetical protein